MSWKMNFRILFFCGLILFATVFSIAQAAVTSDSSLPMRWCLMNVDGFDQETYWKEFCTDPHHPYYGNFVKLKYSPFRNLKFIMPHEGAAQDAENAENTLLEQFKRVDPNIVLNNNQTLGFFYKVMAFDLPSVLATEQGTVLSQETVYSAKSNLVSTTESRFLNESELRTIPAYASLASTIAGYNSSVESRLSAWDRIFRSYANEVFKSQMANIAKDVQTRYAKDYKITALNQNTDYQIDEVSLSKNTVFADDLVFKVSFEVPVGLTMSNGTQVTVRFVTKIFSSTSKDRYSNKEGSTTTLDAGQKAARPQVTRTDENMTVTLKTDFQSSELQFLDANTYKAIKIEKQSIKVKPSKTSQSYSYPWAVTKTKNL